MMNCLVGSLRGPALVLAFCCLASCGVDNRPVQLGGNIFGTTWSLSYLGAPDGVSPAQVKAEIEAAFAIVNHSMNHYDPGSLISTFNASAVDAPIEVDWDFAYVLSAAMEVSAATGGAYDVSVSPLADVWGFGPAGPTHFPQQAEIKTALAKVGVSRLEWRSATRMLSKQTPGLKLDFSSLAKGYAVDLGADALEEMDVEGFMLEVGGEVRVRGHSPRGDAWRIAIERPEAGARGGIQAALLVSDTGIATSGDYRNYFEHQGRRYSHLLDPRTGYPIQHDVVSVTVVHGSAMMADAWATALTIVGAAEALALAEQQGLAIYVLKRSEESLEVIASSAMTRWLEEADSP